MFDKVIEAFNRSLRRECKQPVVQRPEGSPLPPAPPVVPRENTYRKGKVLRCSQYTAEGRDGPVGFYFHGGPRLRFAIQFDDVEGREVSIIDQKLTPEATLLQSGDPVVVSYMHSLRCPLIPDWIFVAPDTEAGFIADAAAAD